MLDDINNYIKEKTWLQTCLKSWIPTTNRNMTRVSLCVMHKTHLVGWIK